MNSTYLFLFLFFSNSKVVSAPKKIHFEVQRLRNYLHRLRLLVFRRRSFIWKITHKASWRKGNARQVAGITMTSTSEKRSGDFKIGKVNILLKTLAKQERTSAVADHMKATEHDIKWARHFGILATGKQITTARKKTNHVYKNLTQP